MRNFIWCAQVTRWCGGWTSSSFEKFLSDSRNAPERLRKTIKPKTFYIVILFFTKWLDHIYTNKWRYDMDGDSSGWLWLYSRRVCAVAAGGQGAGNHVAPHGGGWSVSLAAGGQTQRAGGNWRDRRQRRQRRGGGLHRRWCVWGHADGGTLKGYWEDRNGEELEFLGIASPAGFP